MKKQSKVKRATKASVTVAAAHAAVGKAAVEAKKYKGAKPLAVEDLKPGEPYVAVCRNQKEDSLFIVRTGTDFAAVTEAGRHNPEGTWGIAGRYKDGAVKYDSDVFGKVKPEKLAPKTKAKATVEPLPIDQFSGKPKDLPKIKKGKAPKEVYDVLCWQLLLVHATMSQRAATVAAWGKAHKQDWTADIAMQYLPIVMEDMEAAGLMPA